MQSYSLALVLGWFLIIMSDFNQKFWCLWYSYLIDFHFGMYVNKLKGFIVAKLKVAVTATIINASSRTPGRWLSFWQVCPRLKLRCLPCPRPELWCQPRPSGPRWCRPLCPLRQDSLPLLSMEAVNVNSSNIIILLISQSRCTRMAMVWCLPSLPTHVNSVQFSTMLTLHLIWSQRDWPCSSVMLMETSKLTPMVTTHFICRKDIYIKVAMGGWNVSLHVLTPWMFLTIVASTSSSIFLSISNPVDLDAKGDFVPVWGDTQIINVINYN